jgi:hypothetical protein
MFTCVFGEEFNEEMRLDELSLTNSHHAHVHRQAREHTNDQPHLTNFRTPRRPPGKKTGSPLTLTQLDAQIQGNARVGPVTRRINKRRFTAKFTNQQIGFE